MTKSETSNISAPEKPKTHFRVKEKSYSYRYIPLAQYACLQDLCKMTLKEYPQFIQHLIQDLLQIDGYSETEIAFASGLPLDTVRKLVRGQPHYVNREVFLALFGLYARIFCSWWRYSDNVPD